MNAEITAPAPERKSCVSFADPDGDSWHVQEVTVPMPGRQTSALAAFDSVAGLADALRRAAAVSATDAEFQVTVPLTGAYALGPEAGEWMQADDYCGPEGHDGPFFYGVGSHIVGRPG